MFVGNAGRLPQLVPEQVLKLKQLTVLTLAETNKVSFLEFQPFSFQIHTFDTWQVDLPAWLNDSGYSCRVLIFKELCHFKNILTVKSICGLIQTSCLSSIPALYRDSEWFKDLVGSKWILIVVSYYQFCWDTGSILSQVELSYKFGMSWVHPFSSIQVL